MRVRIDDDRCTGHGRCYTLAPGVFGCDDSGFGEVLGDGELDDDLVGEARLAALNCPERAVVLDE
jgi:ferredoxin